MLSASDARPKAGQLQSFLMSETPFFKVSGVPLIRHDAYRWEIPITYQQGMRVPGRIFASESLLAALSRDKALEQVAHVAHLPGIVMYSAAMPDIHWGYGFPIGGVAATDPQNGGVISPGGIGFDINCGVRLLITPLSERDVRPKLAELIQALYQRIPCGVGQSGSIRLSPEEIRRMVMIGPRWAVERGLGFEEDLEFTEGRGFMEGAEEASVSLRAYERGRDQLGTLGAGNHFLEVQTVDRIFDKETAGTFGLVRDALTLMIHSGSRGFGYQICDDFLELFSGTLAKYGIRLPDQQLACAPVLSPEGRLYLSAMSCAAHFAWCNRQCLTALARQSFESVFGAECPAAKVRVVYDVSHNIAKFENHTAEGKLRKLCVHRKGATRAFPPGHPELPLPYREVGQPVLVPGDMGRCSYVLAGTQRAMDETFDSSCHGAGRCMSRSQSLRDARGRNIGEELRKLGIFVRGKGNKTLAEEQPSAYKNISDVVDVLHEAGLAKKTARLKPMGAIKG